MKRLAIPAILSSTLLFAAHAQERVQKKGPADFQTTLQSAGKAWQEADYGACIRELQTCMDLALEKRAEAIRAALPAAPDGWKVLEEKQAANAAANPFAAAMAGAVGSIVQKRYREGGGRGTIDVTVTADSPLVSMLSMVMANPAADPNAEAVKYGEHRALLKKEGGGWNLQILVSEKHVVEVRTNIEDEERLFQLFDQAAVDRLAAALAG